MSNNRAVYISSSLWKVLLVLTQVFPTSPAQEPEVHRSLSAGAGTHRELLQVSGSVLKKSADPIRVMEDIHFNSIFILLFVVILKMK